MVKMSATNSNFDGPEFFNKNLNDLQNNTYQNKSVANRRSQVVMQASSTEPTITGAYD